jgi:hypothetical protein
MAVIQPQDLGIPSTHFAVAVSSSDLTHRSLPVLDPGRWRRLTPCNGAASRQLACVPTNAAIRSTRPL